MRIEGFDWDDVKKDALWLNDNAFSDDTHQKPNVAH
jgi:hypothetical protein